MGTETKNKLGMGSLVAVFVAYTCSVTSVPNGAIIGQHTTFYEGLAGIVIAFILAAIVSSMTSYVGYKTGTTVDPGIVRGLDYYTKTAFEFVTTKIGAQGTVCGGGRYDHLVEEIGGPATPGVGFGLGKERLLLTMEACGVEIPEPAGADVFIAVMGDEAKAAGLKLMRELRQNGLAVQMDIMGRNIKNQFKYANRIHASKTVVIGQDELENDSFTIKNMETSEQVTVPMGSLAEELMK